MPGGLEQLGRHVRGHVHEGVGSIPIYRAAVCVRVHLHQYSGRDMVSQDTRRGGKLPGSEDSEIEEEGK